MMTTNGALLSLNPAPLPSRTTNQRAHRVELFLLVSFFTCNKVVKNEKRQINHHIFILFAGLAFEYQPPEAVDVGENVSNAEATSELDLATLMAQLQSTQAGRVN
jgi:hypothetical protein